MPHATYQYCSAKKFSYDTGDKDIQSVSASQRGAEVFSNHSIDYPGLGSFRCRRGWLMADLLFRLCCIQLLPCIGLNISSQGTHQAGSRSYQGWVSSCARNNLFSSRSHLEDQRLLT